MQLGQISNGFIDVLMVGRLGSDALAAVALGNATFFLFLLICLGAVVAVSPMVSQACGAGDNDPVGRTVRSGLQFGLFLSIPVFVLLSNAELAWRLMRQDADTIALGQAYLRAVVWGFLPYLWFIALRSFLEAVSRPWPVTYMILVGVGLNVFANWTLMFGKLGFPALGVVGTGWATTIVNWFLVLVITVYVVTRRRFRAFHLFRDVWKPDFSYLRELVRIGVPIGVSYGIEVALFAATAFLAGTLGPTPLAAHQVAIQCAAVTFMVPLGIGIASSVRVGRAVGRRDPEAARWAGYLGILMSAVFMLATATLFWTVPRPIVSLFLDLSDPVNADAAALAVGLLGIAALFQMFDGIQVSAAGALRGLKDTRGPMLICLVSYWFIGFPTSLILGYSLDWGTRGFWWGLVVGLLAASVFLGRRFRRRVRNVSLDTYPARPAAITDSSPPHGNTV